MTTVAAGSTAPAWLSYASPAIALLALLVSLATYRRAGPRIRAKLRLAEQTRREEIIDDILVTLSVKNTGHKPKKVYGFSVSLPDVGGVARIAGLGLVRGVFLKITAEDIYAGEALPHEVPETDRREWTLRVLPALRRAPDTVGFFEYFRFRSDWWRVIVPFQMSFIILRSLSFIECAIDVAVGPEVYARLPIAQSLWLLQFVNKHQTTLLPAQAEISNEAPPEVAN
jgi:hypothetical protein